MALFDESLDKLVLLARSPLAKHVKCLIFLTGILPHWDRTTWEMCIDFLFWMNWAIEYPQHHMPRDGFDYIQTHERIHVVLGNTPNTVAMQQMSVQRPRHNSTGSELDVGWNEFSRLWHAQRNWRQDI